VYKSEQVAIVIVVEVIAGVFLGPHGLRSGWRVLIFAIAFAICAIGVHLAFQHIGVGRETTRQVRSGILLPSYVLIWEGIQCVLILLVTAVFSRVEQRPWRDYGLPWADAFRRRVWLGALWGLAAISIEIAITYALHGFAFDGLALPPATVARYGIEWGMAFLIVAIFEETTFRGYVLQTLARGIGFWPSALICSALFGAIHINNAGESYRGAVEAALFGLFFCFTIYRTGTLWFAIGFHAAWDFGETFVYAVPDSGLLAKGHLINSSLHGPWWVTGGSVGPEGSAICFGILLLLFAVAALTLRHTPVTQQLPSTVDIR